MNRIRGRVLPQACQYGVFSAWLLAGGLALAQQPEQHWQATPNYPASNGPNYQPSAPSGNPSTGPTNPQYQYQPPQQGTAAQQQYPPSDARGGAPAGPPQYGPQLQPDNRQNYPQNPAGPAAPGMGPITPGQPIQGAPIQGPPERPNTPQVPFLLSQPEINALNNLLTDWEKRNKEIHIMESKFYRWKYDLVFGNATKPPPYDEGELKFAAPDKAWMYIKAKDPTQSEQWLCDGKSVFQWDYQKKIVNEYMLPREMQGKGIGDGPLPFVFGVEAQKLKQRYFMRIITPPNVHNEVWLEAYPKWQPDAVNYRKVEVILQISGDERTLFPYAIQIFGPNGKDRIVYQLQDPQINPREGPLSIFRSDWTKPLIPFGWTKRVEPPPSSAPETSANPAMPPRR
jgi:TIGR03009 family protein